MKIEIYSTDVREITGISTKSGEPRPYSMRRQEGFAQLSSDSPYPVRITIGLADGQPAFTPGVYEMLPSSFFINKFGMLALSTDLNLKHVGQINKATG
jgi:hypothetical protein